MSQNPYANQQQKNPYLQQGQMNQGKSNQGRNSGTGFDF